MTRRIQKLWFQLWRAKGVDILVTHSPAQGYGDGEDYAHRGFECFLQKFQEGFSREGGHLSFIRNLQDIPLIGVDNRGLPPLQRAILRKGVTDGSIEPFRRLIRSQDGQLRNDGEKWFSPEEILHMDWLCDCVLAGTPNMGLDAT